MCDKSRMVVTVLVLGAWATMAACQAAEVDSQAARTLFTHPTREFSSGPLWVWNDMLTDEQVVGTLRDLANQHVKQAWVHPRPGLMTPYLSDEWFRLWKLALDEAKRLDMNLWIYDENSYPSGFAGGWVPELMPESRGRGLAMSEQKQAPKWANGMVAVHRMNGTGFENVTAQAKAGGTLPEGRYVVCSVVRAQDNPWHGNRCYVDLMYPGVTEKFIEVTLEPYRKHFGEEFGNRIPGTFTDEPELRPAGGFPWTEDLPTVFAKRWGYSLIDHLPSLNFPVGDFQKVRHNYLQVLHELFSERWGKPLHDYCEKNKLAFTGHYWEHEWPQCLIVPDNVGMYAYHQVPAIDTLFNQYSENTHAQFGNARAVRELASVANQLGRARTLCEAYGAAGWDCRFEDMKRIGDWLYVLGVNTLNQHLSYITLRGARKRDHPSSFSYHEPWWEAYHIQADYFARLSVALTRGEQVNRILLLEPTTTAWMYQTHDQNDPRLVEIGNSFFEAVMDLERRQVEYDIGSEDILARFGAVKGNQLGVGQRAYSVVVIPPMTENVNVTTAALLETYVKAGGAVYCCGQPPSMVDGGPSNRVSDIAKGTSWKKLDSLAACTAALADKTDGLVIERVSSDKGLLFHHRRQLADGEVLFLVNTSIDSPSNGRVRSPAGSAEQWDAATGEIKPYPFEPQANGLTAAFDLPPCGSLLLFLGKERHEPAPAITEKSTTIEPAGAPKVHRMSPNVLTLDYVDVTAGGETKKNVYVYQAGQFAFKKNGMERNPWDSAVQFKDELITKKFPPGSGCEVTYRFTIEGSVCPSLSIVIERPDLYVITVNGKDLKWDGQSWWLDKAFGRMDIGSLARVGENEVTMKASPFTIYHEIESAYLLGEFALKPADRGFVIAAGKELQLGPWKEQGHPLYSAGVSFTEEFTIAARSGRYLVSMPAWYGCVAKVTVNGLPAGYIDHAPWECDATEWVKPGDNTVEVVVFGTLKNTLGPHHGNPPLGIAGPGSFWNAPNPGPPPGNQYSTVGYGLFKPFVLKQVVRVK